MASSLLQQPGGAGFADDWVCILVCSFALVYPYELFRSPPREVEQNAHSAFIFKPGNRSPICARRNVARQFHSFLEFHHSSFTALRTACVIAPCVACDIPYSIPISGDCSSGCRQRTSNVRSGCWYRNQTGLLAQPGPAALSAQAAMMCPFGLRVITPPSARAGRLRLSCERSL